MAAGGGGDADMRGGMAVAARGGGRPPCAAPLGSGGGTGVLGVAEVDVDVVRGHGHGVPVRIRRAPQKRRHGEWRLSCCNGGVNGGKGSESSSLRWAAADELGGGETRRIERHLGGWGPSSDLCSRPLPSSSSPVAGCRPPRSGGRSLTSSVVEAGCGGGRSPLPLPLATAGCAPLPPSVAIKPPPTALGHRRPPCVLPPCPPRRSLRVAPSSPAAGRLPPRAVVFRGGWREQR
uniref:Uncharacterized protein n=1 Tax=Oryza sativa subsp. japonica TaxID=39947 RepID=Q6EPC4_ORYSJ|nr:hypothetical protein [Oryza sativa Japonica Group]BAD29496.1 hypothetical protein [Oryza sativa Japonica Group]